MKTIAIGISRRQTLKDYFGSRLLVQDTEKSLTLTCPRLFRKASTAIHLTSNDKVKSHTSSYGVMRDPPGEPSLPTP